MSQFGELFTFYNPSRQERKACDRGSHIKGLFELKTELQEGPSTSPHGLLPELQRNKETLGCAV